jgi:hypothetical protein
MTDIEKKIAELRKQQAEINRQIRALKNNGACITYDGRVKLEKKQYPRGEEWDLAIKVRSDVDHIRYKTVISYHSRQKTVWAIDDLIHDLETLKAKIQEAENE